MLGWGWGGWFVKIVDEYGHEIDQVPIVDA
jgi:hypothetical protein